MSIYLRKSMWLGLLAAASTLSAQAPGAPTPDSLANLVIERFASGTPAAFDSVFPDPLGRMVVESAAGRRSVRTAGMHRVLWRDSDHAVLLLTGTVHSGRGSGLGTGGNETNQVRRFSGLYEAAFSGSSWRLMRQIPFDTANYIRIQRVHAALDPGHQSRIIDTLGVDVGSPYGLVVRLNNAAQIASVQLNGRPARFELAGGVLWIDAPRRKKSQLVMDYTIADEHGPGQPTDSVPAYGALENTDAWLPFFNYDSGNSFAQMSVTATLPARYYLTTSVPQTESVHDGVRTVHGESMHPQFILALIYDDQWHPVTTQIGDLRLQTFLTPAFRFTNDSLAKVVARVYHVLVPRFGEPQLPTHYLALVEAREVKGSGFTVRMNNAVVSGDNATSLVDPVLGPSFVLGHEVSHGWTMDASGPAANFLQEGWATYAESLLLRDVYGPDVEQAFWEKTRIGYITGRDRAGFAGGFEGRQSILGNPDNGRIHYVKGSWILHSLNYVLGDSVFDRAMREYIANAGKGPNGYEQLIADMSHAAGHDMGPFIMPWLTGMYIPDVQAHVEGDKLIVTQTQPGGVFDLPMLDVELVTATDTVRRRVHLASRADTADVKPVGAVREVHVDPDHRFLLVRHWGEDVTFSLRAPDAKKVELTGVASTPVAATRNGDVWTVRLPLTEGRYLWLWQVDGKSASTEEALAAVKAGTNDDTARAGIRIVRPLQQLPAADAR